MKYAFVNGIILDGTKDMVPQKRMAILTDGTKITDIVEDSVNLSDYEIINLDGKYIMPGLINMHVHLPSAGKPQKKQKDSRKTARFVLSNPLGRAAGYRLCAGYAKTELMSGVTTIRTVGGLADFDSRLRDEIAAGKRIGPRILAGNEGISVPGGHMAGSVAHAVTSPEEAVAFVDKVAAENVDLIKLMITGGVLDAKAKGVPGELKMAPEIVKAACEEAHKKGFYVAAHVESTEGVRVALENGVDSIEHGAAVDDEILQLYKDRHAFLCTTLSPALPYALFDRSVSNASEVEQYNGELVFNGIIENCRAALANDIPVALGNDVGCPYITHYDFWRELQYFHKYAEVSNQFALYTATLRNAELAGISDVTGSITAGKDADLIVTDGNPLEDLKTLRNVRMVMARGRLIKDPKVSKYPECERELDKFID
ncbi:MAG: amidohydrolase family protein [Solobacterium sp.]|nr:amidohydrolase family protein [Solobacterium sp.]